MIFDVVANVPRPADRGQGVLDANLGQHGWWISDETIHSLVEMASIWFVDECSNECGEYHRCEDCPYGVEYANGCEMATRISRAYYDEHKTEDSKHER